MQKEGQVFYATDTDQLPTIARQIIDLAGNNLTYGHVERKYYNPEFIAMGR